MDVYNGGIGLIFILVGLIIILYVFRDGKKTDPGWEEYANNKIAWGAIVLIVYGFFRVIHSFL